MIKKTFEDLLKIDRLVGELYQRNNSLRNTKFGYAYKRFTEKNLDKLLNEYRTEINLAQLDNALEDEKTKEVLIDKNNSRGFRYSKEGLKKLIVDELAIEKKWFAKEVEVEPFFSSFVPEELLDEEKEELKGLLFE